MPEYNNPFDFSIDFSGLENIDLTQGGYFDDTTAGGSSASYADVDWLQSQLLGGISGGSWGDMWDPTVPPGSWYSSGEGGVTEQSDSFLENLFEYGLQNTDQDGPTFNQFQQAWGIEGFDSSGYQQFEEGVGAVVDSYMSSAPWAGGSDAIGSPNSYSNAAFQAATGISTTYQNYIQQMTDINTDFAFDAQNLDDMYLENEDILLTDKANALASFETEKRNLHRTGAPGLNQLTRRAGNTGFATNSRARRNYELTSENLKNELMGIGAQSYSTSTNYMTQLEDLLAGYETQQNTLSDNYDFAVGSAGITSQGQIDSFISGFEDTAFGMTQDWFNDLEFSLGEYQGSTYVIDDPNSTVDWDDAVFGIDFEEEEFTWSLNPSTGG